MQLALHALPIGVALSGLLFLCGVPQLGSVALLVSGILALAGF